MELIIGTVARLGFLYMSHLLFCQAREQHLNFHLLFKHIDGEKANTIFLRPLLARSCPKKGPVAPPISNYCTKVTRPQSFCGLGFCAVPFTTFTAAWRTGH